MRCDPSNKSFCEGVVNSQRDQLPSKISGKYFYVIVNQAHCNSIFETILFFQLLSVT